MFFLVIIITFIIIIDILIKPKITKVFNFQINQFASEKISNAINEAIDEVGFDYTDYVNFKTGSNNEILAIQTNAQKITKINNIILDKVNKAIQKFDLQTIYVHLGSITGINMFFGRGPKIPVQIVSKGISNSKIESKLEEAVINQTLHKINIIVTVEIAGFFSSFSTKVKVDSECMLSESLIIGSIPSHYTKVEIKNPKPSDLSSIEKIKT